MGGPSGHRRTLVAAILGSGKPARTRGNRHPVLATPNLLIGLGSKHLRDGSELAAEARYVEIDHPPGGIDGEIPAIIDSARPACHMIQIDVWPDNRAVSPSQKRAHVQTLSKDRSTAAPRRIRSRRQGMRTASRGTSTQ